MSVNQFLRTGKTKKRIVAVKFVRDVDEYPDLSHLGEYASSPGAEAVTIDRQKRGGLSGGEYRYFIATMSAEETGNPESVEQDYQRMEDYNRQGWCVTFVQAAARISINGVLQTITSGGLAGVESDSEASYFESLRLEQFGELRAILRDIGFSKKQVRKAFKAFQAA